MITFIRDFKGAMPTLQQGIALTLGSLAYDCHPHGVVDAVQCLLNAVDSKVYKRINALCLVDV